MAARLFTSASIGIATSETAYSNAQDLLRDADTAMYRAKALGKARCEVFDVRMRDAAIARLAARDRPPAGDRAKRVRTPTISRLFRSRRANSRASRRWCAGVIPSAASSRLTHFIGVAEETGLIVPLGAWVLHRACTQMSEWHRVHPASPPLTMHVNLSAKQFVHPDLATEIAGILQATGLPASALNLEITESAVIENPDCGDRGAGSSEGARSSHLDR